MVLLVDDDPGVRFMLGLWLEDLDLPYEEAGSGEDALARCREKRYGVVVLDQRMPPGITGVEVATELRRSGYDAPIVLHSAYLNPEVEAAARDLDLPIVEKGDEAALLAAVEAALQGQPSEDQ